MRYVEMTKIYGFTVERYISVETKTERWYSVGSLSFFSPVIPRDFGTRSGWSPIALSYCTVSLTRKHTGTSHKSRRHSPRRSPKVDPVYYPYSSQGRHKDP